jgi:hypothetical protein
VAGLIGLPRTGLLRDFSGNANEESQGTTTMRAVSAPMPRLARVSGREGRILWDLPLSEHPDQNNVGQDTSPDYGDFDGDGALEVVLVMRGAMGTPRPDPELRVVSLRDGKSLWSQKLAFQTSFMTVPQIVVADLDGDHRPEVLVTEQSVEGQEQGFVLRALDGRSGETVWTWSPGSTQDPRNRVFGSLRVARFGDDGRGTVCLGLTAQNVTPRLVTEVYLPPRGAPVKPGLARDDPRWIRPLPWTNMVALDVGLTGLGAMTALALVNVVIPLSILRLAAGRRRWNLRVLMALPLVAAMPLTLLLAGEPLIPILPAPFPGSARMLFALGTLVGLPVVACPFAIGRSLFRRRWKVLLRIVGLTLLMSLIIGAAWLWLNRRSMPAIERYSWSGWSIVALPGIYAVGILVLIGRTIGGSIRLVTRLGRPDRGASPVVPL